jgi:tetratricopeptide (TPR) repeat protein
MRSVVFLSVALIVITLAVYWQVGNHEFLNYDDNVYVTENAHVTTGITGSNIIWACTSVYASNWHPITWLSHMTDAQLYGMKPRGHHLTNVVIHTISTVLLFLLLFRLTGLLWQSSFVAALFALHPLHVESVAWVAERKDVLSAFFWFLTLFVYATYVTKRKPILYFLSLVSFLLGLMSKPMLVTLPAVMLLMDFWPLNRIILNEQLPGQRQLLVRVFPLPALVKEKIPFCGCALFSAAVTMYAQHKGGSIKSFEVLPFWFRIENAVIAYVKYIAKMLWPRDLSIFYPFTSSLPLWQVICSLLVLLLVSAATIWAGRRHPYLTVGWFWFLVTLVPVIGLIQVGGQSMADRYTYIPLTGLFIMGAWGVPALTRRLKCRQGILALLAGAMVIASAAATWRQLDFWRDNFSLYRHALRVTSGNEVAHYNLGFALDEKGDLDAAIREYREALAINPNSIAARNNLGFALERKGTPDAAIREYREAIRLNPDSVAAHYNLGLAIDEKGDMDAAIREYRQALTINPNFVAAHYNLGLDLAKKGDRDAAIKEYREALAINPTHIAAHYNLGLALAQKGDLDTAIGEFQETLAINPGYSAAHNNLGTALEQKGDLDAAIREFHEAIRIKPDYLDAHNNLGVALQQKGDLEAAIREYREALRINSNSMAARKNLGIALDQSRRGDNAGK